MTQQTVDDVQPRLRRGVQWAGLPAGLLLLAAGLLQAYGGWLRWWGPDRHPELVVRQDDASSPLLTPTGEHVVALTPELAIAGLLLSSLALLVLISLPWGRRRPAAAALLVAGALGTVLLAADWLIWRQTGVDPELTNGGGGWRSALNILLLTWHFGAGYGFLCYLAARAGHLLWAVAFAVLVGSTLLGEFLLLSLFSFSHDDPTGWGVLSGVCLLAAGILFLWQAVRPGRTR